jgi:hypothetical protein
MIFLANIIIEAPVKIFRDWNCDKGLHKQRLDLTWCVRHDSAATCEYLSKHSKPTTCIILHKCCRFRYRDETLGPQLADLMCSATNMFIFNAAVFTGKVKGTRGQIVFSHCFWLDSTHCLSILTMLWFMLCSFSNKERPPNRDHRYRADLKEKLSLKVIQRQNQWPSSLPSRSGLLWLLPQQFALLESLRCHAVQIKCKVKEQHQQNSSSLRFIKLDRSAKRRGAGVNI